MLIGAINNKVWSQAAQLSIDPMPAASETVQAAVPAGDLPISEEHSEASLADAVWGAIGGLDFEALAAGET